MARSHLMGFSANCYIVFDIKMDDFHRKVCLVEGGHMTHTPDVITHASVVTRETYNGSVT